MCKERLKSARKYLQTGCTTYRPDLLFCLMLLGVYFVTSKLGLLNVNDFSPGPPHAPSHWGAQYFSERGNFKAVWCDLV